MTARVQTDDAVQLKSPKSIAPALRLSALVVTTIILLVLLLIGWRSWQSATRSAQETGLGLQQLVHTQVERMFDLSEVLLELMSAAAAKTDFDEPGMRASVARDLRLLNQALPVVSSLWIVDRNGVVIVSSPDISVESGEPVDVSDREFFEAHRDGIDRTLVFGPEIGRLTERPFFSLSRSVRDEAGEFLGVVLVALNPEVIGQNFRTVYQSFEARVLIFRASGGVLVSVPEQDVPYPEGRAPPNLIQAAGQSDLVEGPSSRVDTAFVWKLSNYPVYVSVDLPRSVVIDRWIGNSWHLLVSLLATLLALAVAFWGLHRRALVEDRAALALDREVSRQTANLRYALHEKDLLLRELHHRVKNNLQVVMSLLSLQAQRSKGDPTTYFQESQRRLAAIAKMHQHLYLLSDVAALSLVPYLRELAKEIATAHGCDDRIEIAVHGDDVSVALDQATAIVLMAGEVMSNAFKHAFAGNQPGKLDIEVSRTPKGARIVIQDDGPGFESSETQSGSLGMLLIRNLALQAKGQVEYGGSKGARFVLDFEIAQEGPAD